MSNDRLPERGQGDYQYLIPVDDSTAHFMVRLNQRKGRIVSRVRGADEERKNLGMLLYRTNDDRGRLDAVGDEYLHGQEWQYPFGPGWLGRVAIRYHHAKGAVKTYDRWGCEHTVHVEVETGMTMTEMKENPGVLRDRLEEAAADKWMEIEAEMHDECPA